MVMKPQMSVILTLPMVFCICLLLPPRAAAPGLPAGRPSPPDTAIAKLSILAARLRVVPLELARAPRALIACAVRGDEDRGFCLGSGDRPTGVGRRAVEWAATRASVLVWEGSQRAREFRGI